MKNSSSSSDFDKVKGAWQRQLEDLPQWSAESISRAVLKASIDLPEKSEANIFGQLFFWQYSLAFCLSLIISVSVFSFGSSTYVSNDHQEFIVLLAQSDSSWFDLTAQYTE